MKNNITKIFNSYEEFVKYGLENNDTDINGVTREYLEEYGLSLEEYSEQNKSNKLCFNVYKCENCFQCNDCYSCYSCTNCKFSHSCDNCKDLKHCFNCRLCNLCMRCNDCSCCINCYECEDCSDCHSCYRLLKQSCRVDEQDTKEEEFEE